MLLAFGYVIAMAILYLIFGPLSANTASREVLPWYPPLAVTTGLIFFAVGASHWGKFCLVGLAMMVLGVVFACWPEPAPLLFGVANAVICIWWGVFLRLFCMSSRSTSAKQR
jgi:hypothetical protein